MDAFTVVYVNTKALCWCNGKENKSQSTNGGGLSILPDPHTHLLKMSGCHLTRDIYNYDEFMQSGALLHSDSTFSVLALSLSLDLTLSLSLWTYHVTPSAL